MTTICIFNQAITKLWDAGMLQVKFKFTVQQNGPHYSFSRLNNLLITSSSSVALHSCVGGLAEWSQVEHSMLILYDMNYFSKTNPEQSKPAAEQKSYKVHMRKTLSPFITVRIYISMELDIFERLHTRRIN